MEEQDEQDLIRQAMSVIGSRKTAKKAASSRVNVARAVEARTGKPISEEHRAALRLAQAERRERERAERDAISPPEPKRPRGRPKKEEGQAANGQ